MYLNYLKSAADAGVRTAYRSNYKRLTLLEGRYDPTNFFNSNRNIRPAKSPLQMIRNMPMCSVCAVISGRRPFVHHFFHALPIAAHCAALAIGG
jgi:hypothetical protein